MHIKWDVPKGFVHRFRDCFSVLFLLCRNVHIEELNREVEGKKKESFAVYFSSSYTINIKVKSELRDHV